MAGRRLGLRPVGPELGHGAGEVARVDDLGRVRLAGGRIDGRPVAVVRCRGVAAAGRRARCRSSSLAAGSSTAAVADHLDGLVLVRLSVAGRRAAAAGPDRSATPSRRRRRAARTRHVAPVRTDRLLDAVRRPGSRSGEIMCSSWRGCQRFGSTIVVAGPVDDQRRVDGRVVGRRVAAGLVRPVRQARRPGPRPRSGCRPRRAVAVVVSCRRAGSTGCPSGRRTRTATRRRRRP